MPTLTTSYQYLGYSPEKGPVIAATGSYDSRLYLRAKVESYNSTTATIRAEMLIRNSWMGWRASNTVIQLTGASTHKFVNSGSTVWTGAYGGGSGSGKKTYATMWSASTTFDVSYGTFSLGGKVTTGASFGATISNQSCTVNSPSKTLTYNANGGSNPPPAEMCAPGTVLQVTSAQPVWNDVITAPYVVTLNGNNGIVDATSLTSNIKSVHNFINWNTAANGTGTIYNAGDDITMSSNVTLYAQWQGDIHRNQLKLPSGSRTGYILKGYGTSSDATTLVDDPYVPTQNITLYALWDPIKYKTFYKNGSSWPVAPVIKVKNSNGIWMPLGVNIKTQWGTQTFTVGSSTYTIDKGMTWGEFLNSTYNTGNWFFRKWDNTWYIETNESGATATVLVDVSSSIKANISNLAIVAGQTYTTTTMKALPMAYSRLDYVKNSGTQYIDTGFIPNYNTGFKFEVKYQPTNTTARGAILCNYNTTNNVGYELKANGKERAWVKSGGLDKESGASYTTGVNISSLQITSSKTTQIVNGTTTTTSYSVSGACSESLLLFVDRAMRFSTFTNYIKLFYCRVYNGTTLVRNFIPCMRKDDCSIGMYDIVNGSFYPNLGTGTFLYGDFIDI